MPQQNGSRLKTLRDVRLTLPSVYSEASAKTLDAALRKAETMTGRKLSQIPADENGWFETSRKIVWAGAFRGVTPGDQQDAFETWVKKIAATIRKTQAHVSGPATTSDERDAWTIIVDYCESVEGSFDETGECLLSNLFSLAMKTLRNRLSDIHPSQVNAENAYRVLANCRADKVAPTRNALAAYDNLIRAQNRHAPIAHLLPDAPVGPVALLRDAPLDWSKFSEDFNASKEIAIKTAINPDRKQRKDRFKGKLGESKLPSRASGGKSHAGARKVGNPTSARKNHLNALSWLIRHAFPDREEAYAFQSIDQIFVPETILRAVDRYEERAEASAVLLNPKDTAGAAMILSRLQVLAARNGWDQDAIFELEDARFDRLSSHHTREMSKEREQFIRLFQRDPAAVRAVISGPRALAAEAQLVFDDWENAKVQVREEALHLSIGACLLALQLARAVRSRNLNEMLIDGDHAELVRPLREARPWMQISRNRTKNRRAIEGEIPERQWKVIAAWLDDGLPRWCEKHRIDLDANELLLPGPAGVLSRQMFNRIWNRCVERIGVPGLQPHLMRHVAATIWLSVNPGDYATVAAFLCDSIKTVEKFYARGEGAAAANLFAEALETLDPTLGTFLKRK